MPKRVLDVRWLIAAVLTLNLGTLGTHIWLSHRAGSTRAVPRGFQLVAPSGRTAEGRQLTASDYSGHPCHLVRYESRHCGFCQADRPAFSDLLRDAAERSCSVTVVAPRPGEQIEDRALRTGFVLSFPSLDFVRSFPADGTPTTMIADAGWRVVWSKTGALRPPDRSDAWASLP